ncbi:MAG: LamG domain-containing protein, partial [Pirellulales bacterium]|nr:LamG domain-containing protein [Pirellulales bacterium]
IGGRTYSGYMDEVQIYQGSANTGMAQYLYANPGATLATYDAGAYPDPGCTAAPGDRPANAAVRRWKFDGNLNEEGGTAHGTAIGNAAAGTDNGAFAGSGAVSFDGNNDAVAIDQSVISTNKYSIAVWTKDTSGNNGYLFADSNDYANLLLRRFNTEFSFWAGGDDFPNFVDPNTGVAATYDEWHHLVVAIDGEWGNARVYVDGTLAFEENIEPDWGTGNGFQALVSDLYLGNRADLGRDYAGLMDDLQIYNWNLSEADAKLLFDNPGLTLMEVPEPSSLVLLLAAALSGLAWRRLRGV